MYKITVTAKTKGPLFQEGRPAEILTERLKAALWEAILYIEGQVKDQTPVGVFGDSGLRGSIFAEVRGNGLHDLVGVVSSPLPYAESVELGTRPHMPPIAPLIQWSQKILGVSGKEAEKTAWAVAMAINRRGTGGQYMFRRGFQASLEKVREIFDEMGFDIAADMGGPDFDFIAPARRTR